MRQFTILCFVSLFLYASSAQATIFSQIHGVVHDPQHRPIACAHVEVKAANSAFSQTVTSGQDGSFSIASLPLGDYSVTVSETGFAASRQTLTHASDTSPILHFESPKAFFEKRPPRFKASESA